MKPKTIAVIPARGGSKRIQKKNIKQLAGKPLITYTIEAALHSTSINRTFVSTDDEDVQNIVKPYSVEIIERPQELAADETPTIDVVFHVLQVLEAEDYLPKTIVLLQPTSPLRTSQDIDSALELFLRRECEAVMSVCRVFRSPYWSFRICEDYLKPLFDEKYLKMRRQDLPELYMPNGALYVSTPYNLRKYGSFCCPQTVPYIMPPERSVDIDDEMDFLLAEVLITKSSFGNNVQ